MFLFLVTIIGGCIGMFVFAKRKIKIWKGLFLGGFTGLLCAMVMLAVLLLLLLVI